jgi:high-affinity Fe2+/Pb2+ permease
MPSNKSPVFRKAIIPWYHSKTAYGVTIAFMLLVFLFGLAGISVARENIQYNGFIWVPIVLVVLSGGTILFNILRLIRRHAAK